MLSKPGSRLSQTPSNSNLGPNLKSKLDALQGKYNEFMTNCTTLFQEDIKPVPTAHVQYNKILKRRESHNEFFKESEKLRRENTFLSKVVTELSQKVSVLESEHSEKLVSKSFETNLELKKKHLERQEQEMLSLQSELEKTRIELNLIKEQHKEVKTQRSRTPAMQSSVTKTLLRLPKPKGYSPINRNKTGSPISRSVSPKERIEQKKKNEISELKTELQKTIEERNLYRTWKDYCSNHPPVAPGINSIVSHYEIELRRLTALNSILKSKSLKIEKILKDAVNEVEKIQKNKRLRIFDDLLKDLKVKIKDVESEKIAKLDIGKLSPNSPEVLRLSSSRMEKENKDLEDILRRENFIAGMYNEAMRMKSTEMDALRNTFSTLYSFDKNALGSAIKGAETLSENYSLSSTPFGKNYSFELSFAANQNASRPLDFVKQTVKEFDSLFEVIEASVMIKFQDLTRLKTKVDQLQANYKNKIQILNEKLKKSERNRSNTEDELIKLREDQQEHFETVEAYKEALIDKEKYIEGLKVLIKKEKQESSERIFRDEESVLEISALKKKLITYEQSLEERKEKLKIAGKEIEKYKFEKEQVEKIVRDLKEEILKLRENKEKNEQLIDNLKRSVENELRALEEAKVQFKNDIQTYQNEIEKYKHEFAELESLRRSSYELKIYQDELNLYAEKLRILEPLNQRLKAENEDYKEELTQTANSLGIKQTQLESLEMESNVLKSNILSLEKEKKRFELIIKEFQDLKNETEVNKEKIIQLEEYQRNNTNQLNLQELLNKIEEYKNEIKSLKQVNSLTAENQLIEYKNSIKALEKLTQDNEKLILEKHQKESDYLQQRKEVESLNEEIKLKETKISDLQQLLENRISENAGLRVEKNTLFEELKKSNTEYQQLVDSLNAEIKLQADNLDRKNLELSTLATNVSSLENKLKTKTNKCKNYKEINLNLRKTLISQESSTEAISRLKSQVKELDSNIKFLGLKNSKLEEQIQSKTEEHNQTSVAFSNLETEHKSIQEENSSIKQALETLASDYKAHQEISNKQLIESKQKIISLKSKLQLLKKQLNDLQSLTTDTPSSIHSNFSISSSTLSIPSEPTLNTYFTELFQKPLTKDSLTELSDNLQSQSKENSVVANLSEKNHLLEAAYKKLAEEIVSYKSAVQEKIDDYKLDNYELAKENDDLKKRIFRLQDEVKQFKADFEKLEAEKKELILQKTDLEAITSKSALESDEKNKNISELTREITNSNNYVQKILKEKEAVERELANITKSASLDNSQIRNEMSVLQAHISNLGTQNTSLELSKVQVEQKLKKALQEKSELLERQEELSEEIEGLKQIRSKQASQILDLEKTIQSLQQESEQEKKQITDYKNKLATYMVNTNALQRELRSMTPPPRKTNEENKAEDSPTRICHTADSISVKSIDKTLDKLQKMISIPVPEKVLKWCKDVLGQENYIVRFHDNNSGISEDSKSNVSEISSVSEVNIQEGNYRAHAKMVEQRKSIQKLQERLSDKKKRLRDFKGHLKLLQDEIRKLDSQLRSEKNLDLDYLKGSLQKFVANLKNLDSESLKILHVIYSILGLNNESIPRTEAKSKWNIFSKKPK